MLAALEDLLDSWPGTLIVVSHDRYFLERVTDQQYGVMDGRLRHLPGGVDEFLALRRRQQAGSTGAPAAVASTTESTESTALSGAERRAVEKEASSIERRLDKLHAEVTTLHARMADHDQSDHAGLQKLTETLRAVEDETAELEERWLELSELIG